jgi:hypothetical protein
MLTELLAYAEKEGTTTKSPIQNNVRIELKHQLKARLGKILFGDEAFFRIVNDDDPAIEKGLQILKSGQRVK